jgi:hypothetical protein
MVGFFILERHYLLYQYSDYYIFLLPLFLYLYQAAEAMNNTPKNELMSSKVGAPIK